MNELDLFGLNETYLSDIDIYKNSDDNSNRYLLGHKGNKMLYVIGLNPSTANDKKLDQTMRRIIGYCKRNGFDGYCMMNICSIRATNPNDLPIERNDNEHITNKCYIINALKKESGNAPTILVAWGESINVRPYMKYFLNDIIINIRSKIKDAKFVCLGYTNNGYPRHPSRGIYRDFETINLNQF